MNSTLILVIFYIVFTAVRPMGWAVNMDLNSLGVSFLSSGTLETMGLDNIICYVRLFLYAIIFVPTLAVLIVPTPQKGIIDMRPQKLWIIVV